MILYRFFDASGSLLYIGLTRNPGRRFGKHAGDKEWWNEVARIELEQFTNADELRAAEKQAIRTEAPKYNIRMNGANGSSPEDAAEPPAAAPSVDTTGLAGRFFHTWEPKTDETSEYATVRNGRVLAWQGHVTECLEPGVYMVELFSWWDGQPNGEQIALISEMRDWTFYANGLEMQIALRCRESALGRDGECGRECTHVAYGIGMTTVCHRCAEAYSYAVEIVWRNGHVDEKRTLAALDKIIPKAWK